MAAARLMRAFLPPATAEAKADLLRTMPASMDRPASSALPRALFRGRGRSVLASVLLLPAAAKRDSEATCGFSLSSEFGEGAMMAAHSHSGGRGDCGDALPDLRLRFLSFRALRVSTLETTVMPSRTLPAATRRQGLQGSSRRFEVRQRRGEQPQRLGGCWLATENCRGHIIMLTVHKLPRTGTALDPSAHTHTLRNRTARRCSKDVKSSWRGELLSARDKHKGGASV